MDVSAQIEAVFQLCTRLDVEVRQEHLGGGAGGLCSLRGKRILFVDLDSDLATRLQHACQALASLAEIHSVFIPPDLRERMDSLAG